MIRFDKKTLNLEIMVGEGIVASIRGFLGKYFFVFLLLGLSALSILYFLIFYKNGLGLSYNDARSHLDIGRRVVEGLKPGLAQLGSVWLPLPHALMIPTVWNNFMWHSGLSGALISMISFVETGVFIYFILKELGANILARLLGVFVFVANLNILYLQSTAMTELLLLFTITAAVYELIVWYKRENLLSLTKAAFWIMLATLIRYDGWFLYLVACGVVIYHTYERKGAKAAEGMFVLLSTLAAFGMFLWFLWNLLIFKDPLYFAFGPYSAHAQQQQLSEAGNLITKGNIFLSTKVYLYALMYASGALTVILAFLGLLALWIEKKTVKFKIILTSLLLSPFIFNILALYLGFSVLFIQGISGNTWFNVRYGVMMMPSIAILIGYLVSRAKDFRLVIIGLLLFVTFFAFANFDAVTIDDARVGSSQKNVSQVAGWLNEHARDNQNEILIAAASHDAIIFSSGLDMKRFIHEGTGSYWDSATKYPDRYVRYIVMRTNDVNDQTFKLLVGTEGLTKYDLVLSGSFADIYEIKPEFLAELPQGQLPEIKR